MLVPDIPLPNPPGECFGSRSPERGSRPPSSRVVAQLGAAASVGGRVQPAACPLAPVAATARATSGPTAFSGGVQGPPPRDRSAPARCAPSPRAAAPALTAFCLGLGARPTGVCLPSLLENSLNCWSRRCLCILSSQDATWIMLCPLGRSSKPLRRERLFQGHLRKCLRAASCPVFSPAVFNPPFFELSHEFLILAILITRGFSSDLLIWGDHAF